MTTASADRAHQYQRWQGALGKAHWTWPAIVVNGVTLSLKHAKTRTMLLTSGVPVLTAAGVFYVISLLESVVGTEQAKGLYDFLGVFLKIDISGITRLAEFCDVLWRSTFLMVTKFQMFWVLIVVARVGAGLIANDLKARALPIYFSKPVTPPTYLLGKWTVVASFVAMVMLIPSLIALGLGTVLTGGPGTWGQVLSLGVDVSLSGLTVCVVAGAAVLALSSITSDQRYVTVGWVAICILPILAQRIINESLPPEVTTGWLGCISLRDDIVVLTERLLRIRQGLAATGLPAERFNQALGHAVEPAKAAAVLGAFTAAAILMSWRRVVRFSRSAATV